MGETEHWQGKLILIFESDDLEESCRRLAELVGENTDGYKSFSDWVDDWGYKKIHIHKGNIYWIDGESLDADGDIMEATQSRKGEIDFQLRYYNGGCSFGEAMDKALSRLEEKKDG